MFINGQELTSSITELCDPSLPLTSDGLLVGLETSDNLGQYAIGKMDDLRFFDFCFV